MTVQEERAHSLERLQSLLDDPATVDGLERLVRNLPDILALMELASAFFRSAPRLADNAGGIVATARKAMGEGDLNDQLQKLGGTATSGIKLLSELGPVLADPKVRESIRQLLEMLPNLVAMMQLFEQFIASSSRLADNVNGILSTVRKSSGQNWLDLLQNKHFVELPERLLRIATSPSLERLLASELLSDGAINVMNQVAAATIDAHAAEVRTDARVSRIGAYMALGDPDVQRGLSLAVEFARSLGKRVHEQAIENANARLGA